MAPTSPRLGCAICNIESTKCRGSVVHSTGMKHVVLGPYPKECNPIDLNCLGQQTCKPDAANITQNAFCYWAQRSPSFQFHMRKKENATTSSSRLLQVENARNANTSQDSIFQSSTPTTHAEEPCHHPCSFPQRPWALDFVISGVAGPLGCIILLRVVPSTLLCSSSL